MERRKHQRRPDACVSGEYSAYRLQVGVMLLMTFQIVTADADKVLQNEKRERIIYVFACCATNHNNRSLQ